MPESPRAAAEQEHVQVLAATQAASLADFAELMKPVAESIIAFPAPSPHRSEPVQVLVAEPAPAQAGDEQPSSDNDGEPNDNNDLGDIDNDSDSDDASPKGHAAANVTSKHVYTAVYSGIPVYEMMFRGVQIMRRIADGWLNATHILKAAAYSKPRRTKILEQEVLQGVHEKVQGGYGKYQGTWIPKEDGVKLARRHRVEALLRPIIDFEPENGDVALPKLNFNLKHSSGSTSAKLLRPPNNSDASERPRRGGLEPSTLPISGGLTNASRPTSPVPVPSPVSRHRVTQNSYSVNIPVAPQTPPAVPVKRPVGRPPRIPRQPGYLPPAKNNALKLPIQKSRRMSYDHIEVPSSPPGVQIRIGMELGNIVHLNNPFLPAAENDIELATLFRDPSSYESNRSFSMTPHELSSLSVFQDFSLSEMTRDQLQRRIISQIYLGAPIPEILSMLRDSNFVLGEDDSLENDGAGADNRSSTLPLVVTKSSRFVLPPINANMILDSRQQTALHWAAQQARTDLIAALLTHGANACAPSLGSLETPLMRASTTQAAYDADCFADVIALLGGPSARCTDAHGRNILHLIARITVERIGNTTFWREVQEEYMSCVFDWIDDGGFVSWVEHSVMLEYKTNIKVAVAAFVNAKDVDGNTPLYNAIQTGSHNVAEMLVKLGASMDIRNTAGKSPRDMFGDEGVPLAFGTGVSIPFKAHEVENTGKKNISQRRNNRIMKSF
ncbi:transcriptional regulator swi6 [Entophlyctis luteolus]|nr:transcriptional regulator swi6 [Entophlyctis luteolus]